MQIDVWLLILIVLAGPALGAAVMWALVLRFSTRSAERATKEAERVVAAAKAHAEARAKTVELAAEKAAAERRQALDREIQAGMAEVREAQARAQKREETLDRKLEQISKREQRLEQREAKVTESEAQAEAGRVALDAQRAEVRARLETVARMSPDEAKSMLMDEVRRQSEHEAATLSQRIVEDAERTARERARHITLMAIQRYSGESASETTGRTVKIPSEDLKGRING
ncbi:MAG: Rnase Y domain-containing protein, partial [Phycisphaerales bacterium]